jgi:mannose-6-phosphate isomerase-like protein (cupin superfamily)
MNIFYDNIEKSTIKNRAYRNVISTTPQLQLVYMTLLPKEEIGMEKHEKITQFFRVEQGEGLAIVNGIKYILHDGIALIVPANTEHNIINTSNKKHLKLYTIYSPPEHASNKYEFNKV